MAPAIAYPIRRILLALACATAGLHPSASAFVPATEGYLPRAETLSSLEILFEKNDGQLDPAVRYFARANGYHVFFCDEAITLAFSTEVSGEATVTAVRLEFVGQDGSTLEGIEKTEARAHYFNGNVEIRDVETFSRVGYRALLEGVDLDFYSAGNQLEFDLNLAPGIDPSSVRFRFDGADAVSVDAQGDLRIAAGPVVFVLHRPVAYQVTEQGRRRVEAGYVVDSERVVGVQLRGQDFSLPTVIDPILSYSSTAWGAVQDVAVDAGGNAYIAGLISSVDLPASTGYQKTLAGTSDAYVAKLSPAGKLIWATYLGARRAKSAVAAIAVDATGHAYVTGSTDSTSFPTTAGAYMSTFGSGPAPFVTKLNGSGSALDYSTFLPGVVARDLAVDGSGAAYLLGLRGGSTPALAATSGAYSSAGTGALIKLSPTGSSISYATYLFNAQSFNGLAVDGGGNAVIVGTATAATIPLVNALQVDFKGAADAFVAKVNPTGTALIYSTYLGGTDSDFGIAIAASAAGEAYVAGRTVSRDFPVWSAFQYSHGGRSAAVISNAFVSKLTPSGEGLGYSSYLGGNWCFNPYYTCWDMAEYGVDGATSIAIDAAGNAYLGGYATSMSSFPQKNAIQKISTAGSQSDSTPFVSKVSPKGSSVFYTVALGPRGYLNRVVGVGADAAGNLIAVGWNGGGGGSVPLTAGMPLVQGTGSFVFKLSHGGATKLHSSVGYPAAAYEGAPVKLTASVESAQPGGTVSFYDGTALMETRPVTLGEAELVLNPDVGHHVFSATHGSDGVPSARVPIVVVPAQTQRVSYSRAVP